MALLVKCKRCLVDYPPADCYETLSDHLVICTDGSMILTEGSFPSGEGWVGLHQWIELFTGSFPIGDKTTVFDVELIVLEKALSMAIAFPATNNPHHLSVIQSVLSFTLPGSYIAVSTEFGTQIVMSMKYECAA